MKTYHPKNNFSMSLTEVVELFISRNKFECEDTFVFFYLCERIEGREANIVGVEKSVADKIYSEFIKFAEENFNTK